MTEGTERGGLAFITEGTKGPKASASSSEKGGDRKGGGGKEGIDMNDSAIRLPTMNVSVQAQMLIELVYQTLNEAIQTQDTQRFVEPAYNHRFVAHTTSG